MGRTGTSKGFSRCPTAQHALARGETDAFNGYVTNEPWLLGREDHDYRIINPRDYGVNFYKDVLMTSERLLSRKPDVVDAFPRASLRGWEYAMNHVEETVQLIHARYAPDKNIDHLRYKAQEMQRLVMPELIQLGHMNPGRWEVIAESYVALGMSPGPVRPDGFLHTPHGSPDYGLFYRFGGMALLIIGAIAFRFAKLNQALTHL